MAVEFEKLSFTKDWNSASDFPAYEENEAQVRADMQLLHDEVKNFINESLIPGIEGMAVPGAGDMLADVYDPEGFRLDVYAYARTQAAGAVSAAQTNAEASIAAYDTEQTAKFTEVNTRLSAAEGALASTPGAITLYQEYMTPGTYTVTFPAGTVAVYAIAVGAGGAGDSGTHNYSSGDFSGGAGGHGGDGLFVGPVLPGSISDYTVVVGAGSTGSGAGGDSSVFGIVAAGGADGGETHSTPDNGSVEGGSGGSGADGIYADGSYTKNAGRGYGSKEKLPLTLMTFSAGGGGGGCYGGSGNLTPGAGGVCYFGSGGAGGAYGSVGSKGAQCCGGGGGGGASAGGAGGDGYVAIYIQRNNIT